MMVYIILKPTCPLKRSISICLISVVFILASCDKGEDISEMTKPEIELLGLSHDTIVEFQDILTISIEYTDGDGDIGFVEPDRYALFIRDTRLDDFDNFYIGPIAPPDTLVPITGVLDVEFPSLFIFGNANQESTNFEIKMVDRAGNESNLLTTEEVLIVKP